MAKSEFPVQLTERSAAAIKQHLRDSQDAPSTIHIRVSGSGGRTTLDLVGGAPDPSTDLIGVSFGFKIAVSMSDCGAVTGLIVDFCAGGPRPGFRIRDPRGLHSRASDPGQLLISETKLRVLHPELFPPRVGLLGRLLGRQQDEGLEVYREELAEHLHRGDSRAAVVASVSPLVVAAYTDELDCVALLRFPEALVAEYRLQVGSRLLTVNMYTTERGNLPQDLDPGPRDTGQFTNFTPVIADFLATDADRVERRKRAISEDEWERTIKMGKVLISRSVPPRDGRPLYCGIQAKW